MPCVTSYIVVPFIRDDKGGYLGMEPEEAPTPDAAKIRAQSWIGRTVGNETVIGAIAFSRTRDSRVSGFEDALLASYGKIPGDFDNA